MSSQNKFNWLDSDTNPSLCIVLFACNCVSFLSLCENGDCKWFHYVYIAFYFLLLQQNCWQEWTHLMPKPERFFPSSCCLLFKSTYPFREIIYSLYMAPPGYTHIYKTIFWVTMLLPRHTTPAPHCLNYITSHQILFYLYFCKRLQTEWLGFT